MQTLCIFLHTISAGDERFYLWLKTKYSFLTCWLSEMGYGGGESWTPKITTRKHLGGLLGSCACGSCYLKHTTPTQSPGDAEPPTLSVCGWAGFLDNTSALLAHTPINTPRHRFTPHLASSQCCQLGQSVLTGVKGAAHKLTAVSAESSGQRGLRIYCTHRQKWIPEEFTISNTSHLITPGVTSSAGSKMKNQPLNPMPPASCFPTSLLIPCREAR